MDESKSQMKRLNSLAPNLWIRQSNLIEGIDNKAEDKRSLDAWEWLLEQPALTLPVILDLHSKIVHVQFIEEGLGHLAGKWRLSNVQVRGRICPAWHLVPQLMDFWIARYGKAESEDMIKDGHIAFEQVHPFRDGNGRTGRMVMNYQRVKAELEPLLIWAKETGDYYDWFRT